MHIEWLMCFNLYIEINDRFIVKIVCQINILILMTQTKITIFEINKYFKNVFENNNLM